MICYVNLFSNEAHKMHLLLGIRWSLSFHGILIKGKTKCSDEERHYLWFCCHKVHHLRTPLMFRASEPSDHLFIFLFLSLLFPQWRSFCPLPTTLQKLKHDGHFFLWSVFKCPSLICRAKLIIAIVIYSLPVFMFPHCNGRRHYVFSFSMFQKRMFTWI